jgi:DNA-binding response OmpR family regulator
VPEPIRILVIEDDPDSLSAIASILRDEDGFAVWVARNGEQALEVADELGFNADVLVVDLDLGRGMRGDQFVAAYRYKAARPFRLIVVSGVPIAREIGKSIRASAVLEKPCDANELIRTIRVLATDSDENRRAAG